MGQLDPTWAAHLGPLPGIRMSLEIFSRLSAIVFSSPEM
jgi:hypothetical protein